MKLIYLILDIIFLPLVIFTSFLFFIVRSLGEKRLIISNKILLAKGILPTRTFFDKLS